MTTAYADENSSLGLEQAKNGCGVYGTHIPPLDNWISNSNMDINKQLETMQIFASTPKNPNHTLSKMN